MDLEGIFRAHQREIFVYFLRTIGDRERAEDLAQETFLRACGSAVLYRGTASVRTWLFSIARNTLVDSYRRRSPELLGDPPDQVVEFDPVRRLEVEEALRALPILSREAIVLCDVLELSPSDAANVAGISANAFRVRLHRARDQFRKVFDHE
ncbi:MAG: RNA polymerase sigma factor [Actinomycetota bacterium]|nr:RNA polymerase sigma factor [Actinomycetota bacterium]